MLSKTSFGLTLFKGCFFIRFILCSCEGTWPVPCSGHISRGTPTVGCCELKQSWVEALCHGSSNESFLTHTDLGFLHGWVPDLKTTAPSIDSQTMGWTDMKGTVWVTIGKQPSQPLFFWNFQGKVHEFSHERVWEKWRRHIERSETPGVLVIYPFIMN